VSILNFRVASNHRRFDQKSNAWVETEPNWYNVSAFRRLADNGKLSLARGDSVIVTGRLRVREWENNGKRGTSVDLEADSIGPDLRWGTVRYARTSKNGQSASSDDSSADDSGVSDQWAAPLGENESFGDDSPSSGFDRELVGVGANHDRGAEDSGPF